MKNDFELNTKIGMFELIYVMFLIEIGITLMIGYKIWKNMVEAVKWKVLNS